jgi:ADP-ribose pyrophosphatase YjhB (NUDIX family)
MTEPVSLDLMQRMGLHNALWQAEEVHTLLALNPALMVRYVEMPVSAKRLQEWNDALHGPKGRRGEIALAIENSRGEFLLHTKSFYPSGVFRILTGGIHQNERVVDAMHREGLEETGAILPGPSPLAVLFYTFVHENQRVPFISYLFHVLVPDLNPKPQDEDENIAAFQWVDLNGVQSTIDQLLNLSAEWEDWGRMRSLCHLLLLEWKSKSAPRCCCG